MTIAINYVLPTGWAMWLRKPPRSLAQPQPKGKADPTWVTRFALKYQKDKEEPTGLRVPMGSIPAFEDTPNPQQDVDYIVNTICCEYHRQGGTEADHIGRVKDIATTLEMLRANGIDALNLDTDATTGDSIASDNGMSEIRNAYTPDPAYISWQQYRIDSERAWLYSQSNMWRVRLLATEDGRFGREYEGPAKKTEDILAKKRYAKERMPAPSSVEDWEETMLFAKHYGGRLVLALMSDEQLQEHRLSRIYANGEDPDPGRIAYHAANLRAVDTFVVPEEEESIDIDGRTTQHGHTGVYQSNASTDRGYAGPQGYLGLDEPTDDDVYRSDDGFLLTE